MKRFLMIATSVVIGLTISQLFFNTPKLETTTNTLKQAARTQDNTTQRKTNETEAKLSKNLSKLVSKSPENARVFIIQPIHGATVASPVTIKFGIENMTLRKAGENEENSGHHHLLIDLEELPNLQKPLPVNKQLIHFGDAQTETTIDLSPGQHSLQLLFGNYLHIAHDKPVLSNKITITVE